jgi:hypothetical protein
LVGDFSSGFPVEDGVLFAMKIHIFYYFIVILLIYVLLEFYLKKVRVRLGVRVRFLGLGS